MRYVRIPILGDALVVVFDICSSADIIEQLTLKGDLAIYMGLVNSVKRHLARAQRIIPFDPYKFTGDGWILLFPPPIDGNALATFLKVLCMFFRDELKKQVRPILETSPSLTGLTFGIDEGPLAPLTIFGQKEYVGRAIIVASRLQSAIKDKDKQPAYKALVSNAVYRKYLVRRKWPNVVKAGRTLRNIRDGREVVCRKITLIRSK